MFILLLSITPLTTRETTEGNTMSRGFTIITLALLTWNCQSTPIAETGLDTETLAKEFSQPTTKCLTNNESEECNLVLETIAYNIPEVACEPYQLVVDVETLFRTPAGLGDGSISRIDWEFLPDGNAGFWITNIEQPVAPNSSGSISMSGCFSFGDQTSLRITRTITDQLGNESNSLVVDVENPTLSKVSTSAQSAFEITNSSISIN